MTEWSVTNIHSGGKAVLVFAHFYPAFLFLCIELRSTRNKLAPGTSKLSPLSYYLTVFNGITFIAPVCLH